MRRAAETDARDLARGAGANYLGYAFRMGARAPFLLIAAMLYGESSFGEYVFALSVVETAGALALFGMRRSLFKFMSEAAARGESVHRAIANGIALALVTGGLMTLLIAGTAFPLANLLRLPAAAPALFLLSASIPLNVITDLLLVTIRFTRQMRFEVVAKSIVEPLALSAVAAGVWYLGDREYGLVTAYLGALAVATVTIVHFFAKVFPLSTCLRSPLTWGEMRRLISFSGPTAAYEMLTLLSDQADVYLVSYFFPASTVGIYGMARQFATFTRKIRQGFDRILPPVLSDAIAAGDLSRVGGQLALVSRWILSVQVIMIIGFASFGDNVLGLLGGDFSAGALTLTLLLVGDTINGSLGIAELPIIYLRPRVNYLVGAVRIGLTVGLGIWMASSFGLEGVAISVATTFLVVNVMRIVINRQLFGIRTVNFGVLKPVLAGIPPAATIVALLALFHGQGFWQVAFGVPLSIAGYFGTLYALGLEPEETTWISRALKRASISST